MLVLTRKVGETVVVGNSIRITVIELSGGMVRLGFDAPHEVSIYREEIYDEIAAANRAAAEVKGNDSGERSSKPRKK